MIWELMQNYAKQQNIKDVPRRLLIGSYFGKKSDFRRHYQNDI